MTDDTTTITVRKTCPACEGRGKNAGQRHCGYCYGDHKITETIEIDHADRTNAAADAHLEAAVREIVGDV
jgi:DnaJ-class molecular chaperone